jgi:tartrate dehydratase beta subunit/fumarate hydratase class I family protein
MEQNEVLEIIDYINSKYHERVPGPIRAIVKGKIKKIENLQLDELPHSLRKCTVEKLILIVQDGMKNGLVKF